jgi:regulator of replication initiation timing
MKALVGSWDHRPYQVLAELTALRNRIAELEEELREARATNEALRHALADALDDQVVVEADEVAVRTG